MTLERRLRRLLRWYPRAWRESHEEIVLATMMDAVEASGGSGPTRAEARAVIVEGLGMRLDARLALIAGCIALLLAAGAGFASFWGATVPVLPLTLVVVPTIVGVGIVALLRHAGLVSSARALLVVAVIPVAFALSGLTAMAWSLGFDAADEGVEATGLAALWMPLLAVSWTVGALAVGIAAAGMLARTRMPRALAVVTAGIAGLASAPIIGLTTVSPMTSAIAAVALCLGALLILRRTGGLGEAPTLAATRRKAVSRIPTPQTIRVARLLAGLSAAGAAIGVVYALTGAGWSAGATDTTVAMAQGITISLVSTVPLIAAIALVSSARRTHGVINTIGPLALLVLALGAVAAGYLRSPSWSGMAPAFAVSAGLTGVAIAWLLIPRLPGALTLRVVIASLIGLGYAAFLGGLVAPMLAFLMPIVATAFTVAVGGRGAASSRTPVLPAGEPLAD